MTSAGQQSLEGLQITAILDDPAAADLVRRTFPGPTDNLSLAGVLSEGLALALAEAPDVVFIDVGMSKGAGLAVVHHVRSVVPRCLVYALASQDNLEYGTQAIALGAAALLLLPLSGDELLTAVADVRARRAERFERERATRRADRLRWAGNLAARAAEIAGATTRREAAAQLATVLVKETGARYCVVYLPAGERSRQLMQVTATHPDIGCPAFCDEMELMSWAKADDAELIRLTLRQELEGVAVLGGMPIDADAAETFPLVDVVSAQAASALALIAAREQSHRGAMKDPSSSAYTFAYFVDVAGREIDKSRRHGRRFALATIGAPEDPEGAGARGVQVVERVLGAIRATDILARIDDLEFYLLLPETAGVGAHVCRRRVLTQLASESFGAGVTVGVATYPHNGADLSQLLRVAKHRADWSQSSVVRRLELDDMPLPEVLDAILWDQASAGATDPRPEVPKAIELPAVDVVAVAAAALREARRGGAARLAATVRAGVSMGAALRSAVGRESSEIQVDLVDLTKSPGHHDIEALTVVAEHGCYVLLGRVERGHVRGVHAADPELVDLVTRRLGEVARTRLVDD